jgi:aarF domain-containing kinase
MKRLFQKAFIGAGAVGLTSYGTAYYMFPEIRQDQRQLFKAAQRTMRLASTGVHMACIYGLKNASMSVKHTESAKLLHDAFQKNGGIYIKMGQIFASIDVLAPEEYVAELSNLYQNAKTSSQEDVRAQVEESLGAKLEDVFSYFNPTPISSASIAQVHEAYLKNGQKVAVKVQHRWLKEQCQGDIRIVDNMINFGQMLFPEFKYKWFGDELKKNIPLELDFNQEVRNAEKTRECFKKQNNIKVPRVYQEYSTDKVIVMEYATGVSIAKVKEIQNMGLDIKEVAKLLSHCFSQQVFKYGHVHGDPHPGNIFVSAQEDSNGKKKPVITLLDHGLYQTLSDNVRLQYSYLWKGILTRNEGMIKQAATDLGVGNMHHLLVSMISRKNISEVLDTTEKDLNKRLHSPNTQEEKEKVQGYAQQYSKEITNVLHDINRDVLLLFKTNDFLNTITNKLGDPVNKYEILAKYCLETVEQQELKQQNNYSSKVKLWSQKTTTLLGLKFYSLYFSFMSMFKNQQLPDEILL